MGCDYYESENIEITYLVGEEEFTASVCLGTDRRYIFCASDSDSDSDADSGSRYRTELNRAINNTKETVYAGDQVPAGLRHVIRKKITETHFPRPDPTFVPETISEEEMDTYISVATRLSMPYESKSWLRIHLERKNEAALAQHNFTKLVRIVRVRWFTERWPRG